jgi:hypothetical protein
MIKNARYDVPEVFVNVEDVSQKALRGLLLQLQLLHPVVHHDGLPSDLFLGSVHSEYPGQPVQEHIVNLVVEIGTMYST